MGTWLVVMSAVCGSTMLYAICIQTRGYLYSQSISKAMNIESKCVRLGFEVFIYYYIAAIRLSYIHISIYCKNIRACRLFLVI